MRPAKDKGRRIAPSRLARFCWSEGDVEISNPNDPTRPPGGDQVNPQATKDIAAMPARLRAKADKAMAAADSYTTLNEMPKLQFYRGVAHGLRTAAAHLEAALGKGTGNA